MKHNVGVDEVPPARIVILQGLQRLVAAAFELLRRTQLLFIWLLLQRGQCLPHGNYLADFKVGEVDPHEYHRCANISNNIPAHVDLILAWLTVGNVLDVEQGGDEVHGEWDEAMVDDILLSLRPVCYE
mgnify:CR=1 FL=1